MSHPAQPIARSFPALTGVRALAAYLVFVHHCAPPTSNRLLFAVFTEGHVGVAIFYVLSGFLITYRYYSPQGPLRTTLFQYFWNRAARIYPLYFAVLAVTLCVRGSAGWWDCFLQLSLTKGLFDEYKFTGVGQAWSLTVEEMFYVSAPLLFLLFRRRGGIVLSLCVLYGVGGLLLLIGASLGWHGFFGNLRFVALYTFFGRAFEFLAGAWLAIGLLPHPQGIRSRCNTYVGLAGIVGIIALLDHFKSPLYVLGLFHPAGTLLNNIVLPLAIVLFLRGLIAEDTWVRRCLSTPVFELLGRSSYAFYLIHMGPLADALWAWSCPIWLGFLLTNGASVAVFTCFEEPVNRFLKRLRQRYQGRRRG